MQLRQWHGAETRQMESEHAMLAAHASQEMASDEATVKKLQAKYRSVAEALQRQCHQIQTTAKVENDRLDAMLRACEGELLGYREELQSERAQMEAFKKDAQQAFDAYALQSSTCERELQRRPFNLKAKPT